MSGVNSATAFTISSSHAATHRMLTDPEWKLAHCGPVTICCFPVDASIGTETVIGFTAVEPGDVVFSGTCEESAGDSLFWDESKSKLSKGARAQALDRDY